MISKELELLHQLVLTDLNTIAHYRTEGPYLHHTLRTKVFAMTGFPFLEPLDANAEKAKKLLEGPLFRVVYRVSGRDEWFTSWHDHEKASQLFDDPHVKEVHFGGLTLVEGVIRPIEVEEMASILERAKYINA